MIQLAEKSSEYALWKRTTPTVLRNLDINLNELQSRIFWHPARFKLVAGGERAGKSFSGAAWLTSYLWTVSDELFWIMGDFFETCRAEFGYVVQWAQKLNAVEALRFPDDKNEQCVLVLKGSHNRIETKSTFDETRIAEKAPYRLLGCEVPRWSYEGFLRSRGRLAEKRGWGYYSGSFETSHGWFPELYKKWSGPNEDDGASFSLPSWTNTAIFPGGENDSEIKRLESLYPHERFMERFAGIPCPPMGIVFSDFRRTTHVNESVTLEEILRTDREPALYLAIDPGSTVYAVLICYVRGNTLYVLDEIYETGLTHEDAIQLLYDKRSPIDEKSYMPYIKGIAIDVAGKQHPAGESAIEVWERKLKMPTMSQFIHVEDGIMALKQQLKRKVDGTPKALIAPACAGLIMEMGGGGKPSWMHSEGIFKYKTDSSGVVLGMHPLPGNDHAVKALWYLLINIMGYAQEGTHSDEPVSYLKGR